MKQPQQLFDTAVQWLFCCSVLTATAAAAADDVAVAAISSVCFV